MAVRFNLWNTAREKKRSKALFQTLRHHPLHRSRTSANQPILPNHPSYESVYRFYTHSMRAPSATPNLPRCGHILATRRLKVLRGLCIFYPVVKDSKLKIITSIRPKKVDNCATFPHVFSIQYDGTSST